MPSMDDPSKAEVAPPTTAGEAVAHMSRSELWVTAAMLQLFSVSFTALVAWLFWHRDHSFYSTAPWRLPMWLSCGVYSSLALWIDSYIDLFLPRTPWALQESFMEYGYKLGSILLTLMEAIVLSISVEDTRVLVGCTCVVAACIGGLLLFWARLVRDYSD
uniref:DUF7378 domain-containing protein n=1 Tax=Leersia perrieri TaxID=77586 RepID=A0A0D9WAM1_9ORYZ